MNRAELTGNRCYETQDLEQIPVMQIGSALSIYMHTEFLNSLLHLPKDTNIHTQTIYKLSVMKRNILKCQSKKFLNIKQLRVNV